MSIDMHCLIREEIGWRRFACPTVTSRSSLTSVVPHPCAYIQIPRPRPLSAFVVALHPRSCPGPRSLIHTIRSWSLARIRACSCSSPTFILPGTCLYLSTLCSCSLARVRDCQPLFLFSNRARGSWSAFVLVSVRSCSLARAHACRPHSYFPTLFHAPLPSILCRSRSLAILMLVGLQSSLGSQIG